MARRLGEHPGANLLDLASGTGDIPLRLLRRGVAADIVVWVTDLSPAMLSLAKEKLAAEPRCRFAIADAEALGAHPDNAFDAVSISFGMKICDRERVSAEAFRVLKPGGRFLCLEAARIPWPWLHQLYLAYMSLALPLIAWLAVDGDASAYDYLLKGVREFPPPDVFAAELTTSGFEAVTWETLTLGIVALHIARKPQAA
jgi:demethylmenaquinone methyltransferase / 2-methoxy-6-polyprenyl-1,4-benzoquinol methylase